jgi:hypothetical protein
MDDNDKKVIDLFAYHAKKRTQQLVALASETVDFFLKGKKPPIVAATFSVNIDRVIEGLSDGILQKAFKLWLVLFIEELKHKDLNYYLEMAEHPAFWRVNKTVTESKEYALNSPDDSEDGPTGGDDGGGNPEKPIKYN